MIQQCVVCAKDYDAPFRGWYDRFVPWACSSRCFIRMVREATVEGLNPKNDPRVVRYHSPYGIDLRSKLEQEFRQWLWERREILCYDYEPYSFTLSNKKRYVPDFWLQGRVFVEVKGLWVGEGKKKFLMMQDEFYGIPLVVIDQPFIAMLKRTAKAEGKK